ncbi:hypothetical protein FOS14_13625 [Skermania sp. ID1734]|uniref:hypothetical protein n=1 Tax=Skermania sp. ID1734 TaxID=2597516 RepID=UPI00117F7027|nr:hypothetical protein [Skermania sp. ID1734]TSD98037.1 hypothetical protein FOS14_13625 [Skermania sp. ID1734]
MLRTTTLLGACALALAVSGCSGGDGNNQASGAPTTPATKAAVFTCRGEPQVRPATIDSVFCADMGLTVTSITWQSWGDNNAVGTGTENKNLCEPTCAAGKIQHRPVTVTLSNPQDGGFSKITLTAGDGTSESYPLPNSHAGH